MLVASTALNASVPVLVAADTTLLDQATNKIRVHLSQAAFTPSAARVVGDFVAPTFDGYAYIEADTGPPTVFLDPISGNTILQLNEPAGGWHWQTTGSTNLPQTIYGVYVTLQNGTTMIGCELFAAPVILSASGQGIDVGQVRVVLPPVPFVS